MLAQARGARHLAAIGIDFGTSAVRGGLPSAAEPRAIRTPDGAEEVMAVVSFAQGGPHVGLPARSFAMMQPRDTLTDIKTWLVAAAADALPELLRANGGPSLVAQPDGSLRLLVGGEARRPSSIAALVLKRVLELANSEVGETPDAALIAHPLTASAALDAALLAAASNVGLRSVDFVPEPVAAAARLCSRDRTRAVFIADIGACHSTVSVVEVGPDRDPVLLQAASEPIGGDEVTLEVLRHVAGVKDVASLDAASAELLRQSCEQLKRDLATAETASCVLPPVFVQMLGCPAQLALDRTALQAASATLLHVVEDCCARALGASGLSGSEVELYVIGGGARLPFVCTLIERTLGTRARVSRSPSVIALGAAKLVAAKSPTRPIDDVRTRASWRPPPARSKTPMHDEPIIKPRTVQPAAQPPSRPISERLTQPEPPPPPPPPSAPSASRAPSQPIAQPSSRPLSQVPSRPLSRPLIDSEALRAPRVPVIEIPAHTPVPPAAGAPGASQAPPGAPSRAPSTSLGDVRQSIQSISLKQIDGGHIRNPISPAELLTIPGARPIRDSDLEPISLPLLLLLTGSKRRTGTLVVQMDGSAPLRVIFVQGKPTLSISETTTLFERFKRPVGSYHFEEGHGELGTRKEESTMSLVVSGLRQIMRGFDEGSMKRALGDRLQRAPEVSASQQLRMGSLGLTPIELRVVKFSLNGKNTGQGVMDHSGVGPQTVLCLLILLDVFGFVEWKVLDERAAVDRSLTDEIEARARALDAQNYFQVLGVHWSATGHEIEAAYRKLKHDLSEDQPVFAAAPDACRRMLKRVEMARNLLSDPGRRDTYRRQTYPDINFEGVEDLLEKKHRALAMQDATGSQAREVRSLINELSRARGKRKPGDSGGP